MWIIFFRKHFYKENNPIHYIDFMFCICKREPDLYKLNVVSLQFIPFL